MSFNPDNAREGELPPWEVAKAYAFKIALDAIAEHTGTPAPELVGERVDAWIAKQVRWWSSNCSGYAVYLCKAWIPSWPNF